VSDHTECTIMECSGTAEFGYWMPGFEDFSRARDPEHDLLDDGDLSPYVCDSCRKRMAGKPHWEAERFLRPEETLVAVADGGRNGSQAGDGE
jgi:hypothetical protein